MATEDQQQTGVPPITDRAESLRDTIIGDLEQVADRSTSSVIASADELAALAAAADSLDAIAMRQPTPLEVVNNFVGPALDVDRLTHELWNGLQEITGTGDVVRTYATIVSDDAVDVLHACLARQGFRDVLPLRADERGTAPEATS